MRHVYLAIKVLAQQREEAAWENVNGHPGPRPPSSEYASYSFREGLHLAGSEADVSPFRGRIIEVAGSEDLVEEGAAEILPSPAFVDLSGVYSDGTIITQTGNQAVSNCGVEFSIEGDTVVATCQGQQHPGKIVGNRITFESGYVLEKASSSMEMMTEGYQKAEDPTPPNGPIMLPPTHIIAPPRYVLPKGAAPPAGGAAHGLQGPAMLPLPGAFMRGTQAPHLLLQTGAAPGSPLSPNLPQSAMHPAFAGLSPQGPSPKASLPLPTAALLAAWPRSLQPGTPSAGSPVVSPPGASMRFEADLYKIGPPMATVWRPPSLAGSATLSMSPEGESLGAWRQSPSSAESGVLSQSFTAGSVEVGHSLAAWRRQPPSTGSPVFSQLGTTASLEGSSLPARRLPSSLSGSAAFSQSDMAAALEALQVGPSLAAWRRPASSAGSVALSQHTAPTSPEALPLSPLAMPGPQVLRRGAGAPVPGSGLAAVGKELRAQLEQPPPRRVGAAGEKIGPSRVAVAGRPISREELRAAGQLVQLPVSPLAASRLGGLDASDSRGHAAQHAVLLYGDARWDAEAKDQGFDEGHRGSG